MVWLIISGVDLARRSWCFPILNVVQKYSVCFAQVNLKFPARLVKNVDGAFQQTWLSRFPVPMDPKKNFVCKYVVSPSQTVIYVKCPMVHNI